MSPYSSKAQSPNSTQMGRVLIVNPFGVGDALFVTPVIRALHEGGVSQIDVWVGSRTREVFENHPYVNRIFEWSKTPVTGLRNRLLRMFRLISLLWNLRRRKYQGMIDYSLGRQYSFLGWVLLGIPIRVGFNFKNRGTFLTHRQNLPEGFRDKSIVAYYLELLRFLNVKHREQKLELFLTEQEDRQGTQILEPLKAAASGRFLAVAPGGGASWGKDARLKQWPVKHFAQLVTRINREYGNAFQATLILGGSDDAALARELTKLLKGLSVHNLCGKTSLRVAAWLLSKSSLLIGNDSGLIHLAHAMNTPLVALYGPVDPNVFGPYPRTSSAVALTHSGPECRPCYQKMRYQADCLSVGCLTELLPDHVFERLHAEDFFSRILLEKKVASLSK